MTESTGGGLDGSSDARGIEDLFLTEFNSDGTIIWTKQIGTSEWKYKGIRFIN